MATAGDLVVRLGLNANPLTAGLAKAGDGVKGFADSASKWMNPVTAAFAAIAGSAAAAGLSIYGISQRIETLAGVVDKANQTGLSAKFIQDLGFAADQSGVSMDGMLGGLEKMTVALGKAQLNSEETATNLKQIGLESSALAEMKPEDQFLTIADAIAKLPTVAEKAAATVAIFGKSAAEMAPLLGEGEKGIRALMAEADKLHIGISDEDLKSIVTADDAMARMKSSLSSVVSNIAVGMAPVFEQISNSLTDILPLVASVAKGMSEGLASAIKIVADLVDEKIIPPLKEFLSISGDLINKWAAMDDKFEFLGKLLSAGFILGIETIKVSWKEMIVELLNYTAKRADDLVAMLNPKTASVAIADWLNNYGGASEKVGVGREDLEKAQLRFDNLMRELNGLPPLAAPAVSQAASPGMPQMTAEEVERRKAMARRAAEASGLFSAPVGKDPNVKATEDQTRKLLGALGNLKPPALAVVPEF